MAKAYLIGGTPRVGKTTLTLKLLREKPMLGASTDAIRYALRRVIKAEDQPDLFHLGKFTSDDPERRDFIKNHPNELIDIQNKESLIVWNSVSNFIKSNLEDGFDVLIEGIAVLPELVKQLDCEYRVVFIGNKSKVHFDTILNTARDNSNDWMHNLEEETIRSFCIFNQRFSEFIEDEAKKYDLPYVEMSDSDFESSLELALILLRD